jgi:hypothetical protein
MRVAILHLYDRDRSVLLGKAADLAAQVGFELGGIGGGTRLHQAVNRDTLRAGPKE